MELDLNNNMHTQKLLARILIRYLQKKKIIIKEICILAVINKNNEATISRI